MAEIKVHYDKTEERTPIDKEWTAKGYHMIADDFDEGTTTSGTMTYTDLPSIPIPEPPIRDPLKEIDELKARLDALEVKSV